MGDLLTQTPVAPAQGQAVTPVTIVAGVLATATLPTLPSGGPVPWRTPWLVVLNSSPYTLLVASGSTVTQIAAFTSDKIFVQATGLAPTLLPVQGAQVPAPGQDSTAYLTWYAIEPPGTYPAALGSGSANFSLVSLLIEVIGQALANNANTLIVPATSTQGFGGISIAFTPTATATITITWQSATNQVIAQRSIIVRNQANFTFPHVGPFVTIRIANASGAPITFNLTAYQITNAIASWTPGGDSNLLGTVPPGTSCPANTAGTVVGTAGSSYVGPAKLYLELNGCPSWSLELRRGLAIGAFQLFATLDAGDVIPGGQANWFDIMVPPAPFQIAFNNNAGAAFNVYATVYPDDFRVGG